MSFSKSSEDTGQDSERPNGDVAIILEYFYATVLDTLRRIIAFT